MAYTMQNGRHANTRAVALNPLGGAAVTANGKSAVIELGDRAVLRLRLLATANSGSSPVVTAKVETSYDGVTWRDVDSSPSFTQVASSQDATWDQRKAFVVDRFVRADYVVGGGSPSISLTLEGEAV